MSYLINLVSGRLMLIFTEPIFRFTLEAIVTVILTKGPVLVGRDVRKNHKDYNQVVLDVRRSMKRFPKGVCVLYYVHVLAVKVAAESRAKKQHAHAAV